jgi:hypothetical protein
MIGVTQSTLQSTAKQDSFSHSLWIKQSWTQLIWITVQLVSEVCCNSKSLPVYIYFPKGQWEEDQAVIPALGKRRKTPNGNFWIAISEREDWYFVIYYNQTSRHKLTSLKWSKHYLVILESKCETTHNHASSRCNHNPILIWPPNLSHF